MYFTYDLISMGTSLAGIRAQQPVTLHIHPITETCVFKAAVASKKGIRAGGKRVGDMIPFLLQVEVKEGTADQKHKESKHLNRSNYLKKKKKNLLSTAFVLKFELFQGHWTNFNNFIIILDQLSNMSKPGSTHLISNNLRISAIHGCFIICHCLLTARCMLYLAKGSQLMFYFYYSLSQGFLSANLVILYSLNLKQ